VERHFPSQRTLDRYSGSDVGHHAAQSGRYPGATNQYFQGSLETFRSLTGLELNRDLLAPRP